MRKGFEHAGGEMSGAGMPEMLGLPVESLEVQAALMLAAFRDVHAQSSIDVVHWEQNDEAIQSAAMNEWVGEDVDDPNSLAALYRAYADAHPHMRVDIADNDALEELLGILVSRKDEMH